MTSRHTRIAFYGLSDTGLQRPVNEDHFVVADLTQKTFTVEHNQVITHLTSHLVGPKGTLLAVADGLGGYEGGELASQLAVETTTQALFALAEQDLPLTTQLNMAIEEAHQAICRQHSTSGERRNMASTLTAVHIGAGVLTIAQVGDSRAYLCRDGHLTLLTEDQTVVHFMQKSGVLTLDEARSHPHRHLILQALGQDSTVQPDVRTHPFQHGDWLLLCTDGLSSYVSAEKIEAILASEATATTRCQQLVQEANAVGGADNITVLVAQLLLDHGEPLEALQDTAQRHTDAPAAMPDETERQSNGSAGPIWHHRRKQDTLVLHTKDIAMAGQLYQGDKAATHCFLVLPTELETIARELDFPLAGLATELPEPPPPSGVLVCLPHSPVYSLPMAWTGVWARHEAPPPGPWVPLPPEATGNVQALERALLTAELWRRERCATADAVGGRAAALKALNEIGIALSAERDPARLLELILSRARHIVAADAGSLYLVEKDAQGHTFLRFALAQNDSVNAPWKASLLPLNRHSVAGAVAQRNTVVVIDDVYALPADSPIHHDDSFDRRFGYRTRSVVGIPLATRSGEVLGVLQLINRKPHPGAPLTELHTAAEVLPFSTSDVELLRSLASQAAVSIENARLYEDIQRLFEGFVTASVTAIEQRDPTTSGHSARVADGTVALARRIAQLERGPWAGSRFSEEELRELRYAALLHDFGKIGVREKVLTKANKLYEEQLDSLEHRFLLARTLHRAERFEAWLQMALQDPESVQHRLPQLYTELHQELASFDTMLRTVKAANQPNIVADGDFSALRPIRQWEFLHPNGNRFGLLTEGEIETLSLRRGSLTAAERAEIESHVTHSYHFLRTIPWTRALARVPELAYGHHEKLDGSGYPRGLQGDAIPLGVRIMTIVDIFDALTASDRPYKRALPLERALGLLEAEARAGKLDTSLVQLWIEARAWEDIRA